MIKQSSSSSVALSHEEKGCSPDLLIISENGKQLALFSLSFVPVCFTDFNTAVRQHSHQERNQEKFYPVLTELFYRPTVEDLRLSSRIFYKS